MYDNRTKCLKELENGDTMMNERIILVIKDSVLLTEHYNTYNFPGGSIPFKYLNKNIGTTSMKELEEELGITFKNKPTIKLAGYYFDYNGCLKLLVFAKVKQDDILFGKAIHVWESKSFTLIPVNDNINETTNLGKFLEDGIIRANNECATHITYRDEMVDKVIYDSDSDISEYDKTYYIKLTKKPDLSVTEKEILKMLNSKITGYNDEKYVYMDDYICKYKYIPFNEIDKLSISNQFNKSNQNNNTFNIKVNYEQLLDYLYKNKTNALYTSNDTILNKNKSNNNIRNMYNKIHNIRKYKKFSKSHHQ